MNKTVKLQRRKIEIELDDELYKLKTPQVEELKKFKEMMKCAGEDVDLEKIVDFLDSLGLPKKVGMTLEMDHFELIFEALHEKKK